MIGNTKYSTLQDAINTIQADGYTGDTTITLIDDIDINNKITINKSMTLNTDFCMIGSSFEHTNTLFEVTGGTFTVRGSFEGIEGKEGKEDNTPCAIFKIPEDAQDAHIDAGVYVMARNCTAFDIRSGTFKISKHSYINNQSSKNDAIVVGGGKGTVKVEGEISDCSIPCVSPEASGIKICAGSNVTI